MDRNFIIKTIEENWEIKESDQFNSKDENLVAAVAKAIGMLDRGEERVAYPDPHEDGWTVATWLKKAVLLSFAINGNELIPGSNGNYFDKVLPKTKDWSPEKFREAGFRFVPGAFARTGSFIDKDVVVMPSYINIGAHVGAGSMIDTWATVGSCAQVGKNCHISGGVGIGGVLEPVQANPVIIEDNCFIGARSEIVEGVIVGKGSVISMGVFIGQSTKIYNRETDSVTYGRVPPGSVVIAGSLPSENGKYNLNCAVIVKQVDEKTRAKTSINDLLRDN